MAKNAAYLGWRYLIEQAGVVCCTASVANESDFQIVRRAHAVALEEARRAGDVEFMGFMSNYWDVCFRLFIRC